MISVAARIFLAGWLGRQALHDVATAAWLWAGGAVVFAVFSLASALIDFKRRRRLAE